MASLALGVKFNATSSGTGDFVDASSVAGYLRASGNLVNGKTYRYRAENAALTEWEWGTGVWTSGTNTLARATVQSSSTGSKVSFTAAPLVGIVIFPQDLAPINGYLFGLTLSTAGSSATFGVAAGSAADSNGIDIMTLGAAYTKTTSAWAVGSGNGGLDTGTIANSTGYHVHQIKRPDSGVVDALVSLSATAPTLPTNYTMFRRIGWMKTGGTGNWVPFSQIGDEFMWAAGSAITDLATTTLGTTPQLVTLQVPTGVKVKARIRGNAISSSILISSPDQGNLVWNTPPSNQTTNSGVATSLYTIDVMTNTSAQVQVVAQAASATASFTAYGWIDRRGRDD